MTIAQKMLDERKLGCLEGLEDAVAALKGILDPEVIAERFKNASGSGVGHFSYQITTGGLYDD